MLFSPLLVALPIANRFPLCYDKSCIKDSNVQECDHRLWRGKLQQCRHENILAGSKNVLPNNLLWVKKLC